MIHRVRIRNFMSLRDVTVDLSPVAVLIGKSGTGKTNFAQAIRFLRNYLNLGGRVVIPPPQWAAYKSATNPKGRTEFEVEFDVPGFPERFAFLLEMDENHPGNPPRMERLLYGGRAVFQQSRKGPQNAVWDQPPSLVSPPPPGPPALGRLPGLEEAVVAFTALTVGIGVYAFPGNVLVESKEDRVSGLADDGSNFFPTLQEIASDLHNVMTRKAIIASLQKINTTVNSVDLDLIQNPTHVIVGHRLGDKVLQLELRQESEGFRRFYAHLLALYQSRPKQTLVFEEPENGIYPGALSLLADEFKTAHAAGRGQVILTTHSPTLLDHFSAQDIRVVEQVNLETQIGPVAEEQREAVIEQLLQAGELLTVDPARREGE